MLWSDRSHNKIDVLLTFIIYIFIVILFISWENIVYLLSCYNEICLINMEEWHDLPFKPKTQENALFLSCLLRNQILYKTIPREPAGGII